MYVTCPLKSHLMHSNRRRKSPFCVRPMNVLFCMFQVCWPSWTRSWAHWASRPAWAPWWLTRGRPSTGWGWTARRGSDPRPAVVVTGYRTFFFTLPQCVDMDRPSGLYQFSLLHMNSSHRKKKKKKLRCPIMCWTPHEHCTCYLCFPSRPLRRLSLSLLHFYEHSFLLL